MSRTTQISIDKLFDMIQLNGVNQFHCENCNNMQDACQQIHATELPKYLFIQVRRYKANLIKDESRIYANTQIRLPLQRDASNIAIEYKLQGLVHHSGRYGGGHYTASVIIDSNVYMCNDHTLYQIRENQIDLRTLYLAVYQRI